MTNDLVTRDDGQAPGFEVTGDQLQIGAAHRGRRDPQRDLARRRLNTSRWAATSGLPRAEPVLGAP